MPVHDWTRVGAGVFHAFHCAWITQIQETLNSGILPEPYYALAEQVAGELGPDVLTLQANGTPGESDGAGRSETGAAVALAPPKLEVTTTFEMEEYARKQRALVIRHSSDDRVVALIEIVSSGNKGGRRPFRTFVEKAARALAQGCHLLLIDLYPPGPGDPQGIHGALSEELGGAPYQVPPAKPLTLASYEAGVPTTAHVAPVAVGAPLSNMPLYLARAYYVWVPLETTYQAAWRGVPQRWKRVLEAPAT
jgi:hypothetical protein